MQTIEPNNVYSSDGNQIQDGFSSTAGGFGNTFEALTKIDIKDEEVRLGEEDKMNDIKLMKQVHDDMHRGTDGIQVVNLIKAVEQDRFAVNSA